LRLHLPGRQTLTAPARRKIVAQAAENKSSRPKMAPSLVDPAVASAARRGPVGAGGDGA